MEERSDRGQRWMEGEEGENGNNIKRTDACWGRREGGRAAGGANTTLTRCDMHDQKHVTSKDIAKQIVTLNEALEYESVQDVARAGRVAWSSGRASRFS